MFNEEKRLLLKKLKVIKKIENLKAKQVYLEKKYETAKAYNIAIDQAKTI